MERSFAELALEGLGVRRVLSARGVEALSTLFRYEVNVEIELPLPDPDALIGAEASLLLRDPSGGERTVTGVVAEASAQAFDNGRGQASVVLRPTIWRQSLGRDCYASQDVGVKDVVDDVLADYTGKYRWEVVRGYPRYPYRVQYREDDWTYVSRLLEEEGIYYWFDHEATSVAVFSDNSTVAPEMPGGALLPWVRESALLPDQDAITELGTMSAAVSGRFSLRSFDLKRPLLTLAASAGAGRHEVYDAPGGGWGMEAILEARVRDQREAATAAHAGASGLATSIRPYPGRILAVERHPVARLNGRYLVTRVEVQGDEHTPCSTRFSAIREEVPFRPERVTPEAKQAGLQLGQVLGPDGQEVHPDELARVRVILHWDRLGTHNELGGTWMRVAQRGAPGSMLFPRMGWNVATFNEEGGVDAPSLICRIHDGEHRPEYALPMNMTRVVFKTATVPNDGTTNEVYFEDREGGEEMFINASRDMTYRVLDAKFETVQNDSTRAVGSNHDLTVSASLDERVIGDHTLTIGGDESLKADGMRMKTVAGNENETISGSRSMKVGDQHATHVSQSRTLIVGGSMNESTPNSFNAVAREVLTLVGSSAMKISGGEISEASDKRSQQKVSGAKVEIAKKDRALDVTKIYTENVTGEVLLVSNEKYLDNADNTATWKVTDALAGRAPEIHIEAVETIRLKCGESVLTVTKDAITLTGKDLDLSGAQLDADSASIAHN